MRQMPCLSNNRNRPSSIVTYLECTVRLFLAQCFRGQYCFVKGVEALGAVVGHLD